MPPDLAPYIEDVALYWEQHGLPRIAGRIIGLLLVCDPPHRSAAELLERFEEEPPYVGRLKLASLRS